MSSLAVLVLLKHPFSLLSDCMEAVVKLLNAPDDWEAFASSLFGPGSGSSFIVVPCTLRSHYTSS